MSRALAALIAFAAIAGADPQDPREIVSRSLKVDSANLEKARNYTLTQRTVEKTFDGAGNVKQTESRTREFIMIHGEPYARLVAKNDKPLAPDEQKKQEEKLRRVSERRAKESEEDRKKRHLREREFLQEVPDAYDFKLLADESIEGAEAWVVEAEPKPGYQFRRSDAKVLAKFRGKLWITKDDYHWVKADVEAIDTVSFGLFIARLQKGARIQFEQTRVNNEVWLPRRVHISYDVRLALVKHLVGEMDQTSSNYRKFQADSKIVGVAEK